VKKGVLDNVLYVNLLAYFRPFPAPVIADERRLRGAIMGVIKCFNRECRAWDLDKPDHCSEILTKIQECEKGNVKVSGIRSKGFYVDELSSNSCPCGETKKRKHSLCPGCYLALPPDLMMDLYLPLGEGYEEAYEAAVQHLEEIGRI